MSRTQCKPLPPLTESDIKRFWDRVDKRGPEECWPWTGGKTTKGYGLLYMGPYGTVYATRIAHFLATGKDPFPLEMRHSCDNPPCCNALHLSAGTHQQNMQDAVDRRRTASGDRNGSRTHPESRPRGIEHPATTLTVEQVEAIRVEFLEKRTSAAELGRRYGMGPNGILKIVKGDRWKSAPGPISNGSLIRTGELNPNSLLSNEKVQEIVQKRANGATLQSLCIEYNVTMGSIYAICDGQTWTHITGGKPVRPRKKHLTPDLVREIRRKYAEGVLLKDLAAEYGMSIGAIHALSARQTWSHVD